MRNMKWVTLAVLAFAIGCGDNAVEADANYRRGLQYDKGDGVPKDEGEGAKWFRKSAEQGHAPAQYSLAVKYKFGRGVPKDDGEAAKWFKKAAEQGYAGAQYNLGHTSPDFLNVLRDKAAMDIQVIESAIGAYRLDHRGALPNTLDLLWAKGPNGEPPKIDPDRLEGGKLLDPWGTEYVYNKINSTKFEIISYGADKLPGGEGDNADISSVKKKDG